MKRRSIYYILLNVIGLFLLTLLLACGQNSDKAVSEKKLSSTLDSAQHKNITVDTLSHLNKEYLDWDSLKINNLLPLLCKKTALIELLGQPDSTVVPNMDDVCASYFNSQIKFLYYGKSYFENSGDSIVISTLQFENNNKIKLNIGDLVLDNSLTLDKLATIFPNAVKLKEEEVLIDKGGRVVFVRLASSKIESDFSWYLFFKDGKLIRIDYFMPC
jgi:hypothetical protein